MKIITRAVLDLLKDAWIDEDAFEYEGPLALCGMDTHVGGAMPGSLLNPQVITATTATPSGQWTDVTQYRGYCLYLVLLGTITATSVQVQLQSSASPTGSSPVSGGAAAQFPLIAAAASPTTQLLCLPASYFAKQYVGANAVVAGAGNVPIAIHLLGEA